MHLHLSSFSTSKFSTLSTLSVDGIFECFALEDEKHYIKLTAHTRIPEGRYVILLRSQGGMDARYTERFGNRHKGMLWLMDVPGFKYIYIHYGNEPADTEGCILVGNICHNNQRDNHFIGDSISAYLRLYDQVVVSVDRGEPVVITVSRIS